MNKQWEDQYLEQAIDDEIELALVKMRMRGAKPIAIHMAVEVFPAPPKRNTHYNRDARTTLSWPLPAWRRKWSDAGPLSTELGLSLRHDADEATVSVGVGSGRRNVTESYADHPSIDAATMAAIVRAAIQLLTSTHD